MPRRGRPTLADAAVGGDRLALARLLTAVENRTAGRRGRPAPAVPDRRAGAPGRDHRAARLGQVDARGGADRRGAGGRPVGGGHRRRSVEPDHRRRAARRPRPDAGLRRRRRRVHPLDGVARARRRAGRRPRRRPRRSSTRPASTSSSSRPSGPGRARSRSRPRRTRRSCSRRPRWATRSRRSRRACSRSPTWSSSTRATSPVRSGPRRSSGRCWSPSAPRGDGRRLDRPRPKRPEVLITTAATGDGVPELLAALDRHRAAGRVGDVVGGAPGPCRGTGLGDRRRPAARAPARRRRTRHPPRPSSRRSPTIGWIRTRPRTGLLDESSAPTAGMPDAVATEPRHAPVRHPRGGGPRVLHRRRDHPPDHAAIRRGAARPATRSRSASCSPRSRSHRSPSGRSSAGRQTDSGAGRCSSAAPC